MANNQDKPKLFSEERKVFLEIDVEELNDKYIWKCIDAMKKEIDKLLAHGFVINEDVGSKISFEVHLERK